jgi:hypothetical protein
MCEAAGEERASEEQAMSERDNPSRHGATREEATDRLIASEVEPRQPPTLSPDEAAAVAEELSWEELMEEPPQGDLSVISDEDVPGTPG